MRLCFYRIRGICPAKMCYKNYEGYGNHAGLRCPEGMNYKEDEIPEIEPSLRNINALEKRMVK